MHQHPGPFRVRLLYSVFCILCSSLLHKHIRHQRERFAGAEEIEARGERFERLRARVGKQLVDQPLPAGLTTALGGCVTQWYSLPPQQQAQFRTKNAAWFAVPIWVENVQAVAQSPVSYENHSLPGIAALQPVIEQAVGNQGGVLRYVGMYPPDPAVGVFSQQPNVTSDMIERIALTDGTLHLHHSATGHAPYNVERVV